MIEGSEPEEEVLQWKQCRMVRAKEKHMNSNKVTRNRMIEQ